MPKPEPVTESARIQSLDVLRGFALLGILLLNIIGFGLHSASYFNPTVDGATSGINLIVWGSVDVLFEGSMRCLFSILFGAGVVLFTTGSGAKSAALYYRRSFWLLMFGLLDIYLLLWLGDILVAYAVAGAILFLFRNRSSRWLLIASITMVLIMSAYYAASGFGLNLLRTASQEITSDQQKAALSQEDRETLDVWWNFESDFAPKVIDEELAQRRGGFQQNLQFNLKKSRELFTFQMPLYSVPDALAMMLLGMALFKAGVLSASRSRGFYVKMALIGFASGLTVNLYEVVTFRQSSFDILVGFPFVRPTYHIGRLGMATGYLGVVMLVCKMGISSWLAQRLAAVGRMALTNYLSHSLICLILFTGVGFSLLGTLDRWMLYPIVLAIWVFQLLISFWWLSCFKFGPVEWLWRLLTYGERPPMSR
jgi:uncharacterized protein|tara:strand:- start:3443 stop:4714 length:1272 start_codon:yes stop_codon:yes gene_type:complete